MNAVRSALWLVMLAVFVGGAPVGAAQTAGDAPLPLDLRDRTFDAVWTTVRDQVYDPGLVGAAWDSVRAVYAPRVAEAETNETLHLLLSAMVGELDRSHVRVDPPHRATRFEALAAPRGAADPGTGLQFDVVEGEIVVVDVAPGSASEAVGVCVGDVVRAVDGQDLEALREAHLQATPALEHMAETFLAVRAVLHGLDGEPGAPVRLSLDSGSGRHEVEVVRQRRPTPTAVTWRREGDVGVVRVPLFFHGTGAAFGAALDSLDEVRGLVIDLRGTPGGLASELGAIAGAQHGGGGSLGTVRRREPGTDRVTEHPLWFTGQAGAYGGPVVVLVDGSTASSAEVMAAGLQSTGRARIVGRQTVGAVLPMGQVPLPSGGMLRLPVAEIRPPDGRVIEGVGIEPDVVVARSIGGLRAGRDEDLDAALGLIREAGRSPGAGSAP